MKQLTFQVTFQELRVNGNGFNRLVNTETEFHFMLNRNPDDKTETHVGVSASTLWTFLDQSSAILQCVSSAFPKAFLIEELSFEELITVIEAAIGQINLDLPPYLEDTVLPKSLQISDLNKEKYMDILLELYDKFQTSDNSSNFTI